MAQKLALVWKAQQHSGANSNYPLISMHLKSKDWRRFWRKERLQNYPNGQVMAICQRSPKTRIFLKVERGDQEKLFKNRQKCSPRLKGQTALWRKWHYPLNSMHLKCKDWRRFWGKKADPKVREWPSCGNFGKVTQNPHFLKKYKGGTKRNFSKIAQKVHLVWKAPHHSGANGIIL